MCDTYCRILGSSEMSDRLSFLKRISTDGENDVRPRGSVGSVVEKGDRKSYIAGLQGAGSSIVAAESKESSAVQRGPSIVKFATQNIVEFRGNTSIAAAYRQPVEAPRVRPNYDSSKRKLYANPQIRQS